MLGPRVGKDRTMIKIRRRQGVLESTHLRLSVTLFGRLSCAYHSGPLSSRILRSASFLAG